jgi:hypothetical protein
LEEASFIQEKSSSPPRTSSDRTLQTWLSLCGCHSLTRRGRADLAAKFRQAGSQRFRGHCQLLLGRPAGLPAPRETCLVHRVSSAPSASFAQSAASRSHASRSIGLRARWAFRRHSSASQRYLFASDITGSSRYGRWFCAVDREEKPVAASHEYGRARARGHQWVDGEARVAGWSLSRLQ